MPSSDSATPTAGIVMVIDIKPFDLKENHAMALKLDQYQFNDLM